MSNEWSSYEKERLLMESWRKYLQEEQEMEEGFLGKGLEKLRKKFTGGRRGDAPPAEAAPAAPEQPPGTGTVLADPDPDPAPGPSPGPSPTPTPAPAAPKPPAADAGGGETIPISGTELQTMQYIAKKNGTDIFRVTRDVVKGFGAMAKNPQVAPVIKAFQSKFFPQLQTLGKRVNIAVAEELDLESLWNELLAEAESVGRRGAESAKALSTQTQRSMKGRMRAGQGMTKDAVTSQRAGLGVFKSLGGKPPMVARKIEAGLRDALLTGVDEDSMMQAFETVASKIQDPKAKQQYDKQYENMLLKNPQKRIQVYKENVEELIAAIVKMATEAATAALGASPAAAKRKLPEHLISDERIRRMIIEETAAVLKER